MSGAGTSAHKEERMEGWREGNEGANGDNARQRVVAYVLYRLSLEWSCLGLPVVGCMLL